MLFLLRWVAYHITAAHVFFVQFVGKPTLTTLHWLVLSL